MLEEIKERLNEEKKWWAGHVRGLLPNYVHNSVKRILDVSDNLLDLVEEQEISLGVLTGKLIDANKKIEELEKENLRLHTELIGVLNL